MKKFLFPLLTGVFVLGLVLLPGCSCATTGDCPPPPAPVYTPPPPPPAPPPCDPCGNPIVSYQAPVVQTSQVAPAPAMRNYSPTPTTVSMYPLSTPQPRNAPPVRQVAYAPAAAPAPTYASYEPEYAPAYTRPATGVCWVVPPGQTVMPDPPSVTVTQTGAVVSSTPTGHLYPPAPGSYTATSYQPPAPTYSPPPYQASAPNYYEQQPSFGAPTPPQGPPPPVVPVPELPAPFRETAGGSSFGSPTYAPVSYTDSAPITRNAAYAPPAQAPLARPAVYETPQPSAFAPQVGGMQLVPAYDVPPTTRAEDVAPSQWFEIIRPGNGPIRIGRVSSACVCVGVRVPNRYIAQGERALVEVRIRARPAVNNLTYAIGVEIIEPQREVLAGDVTVRL